MQFVNLQKKMGQMQTQYLNGIKETVGCEQINIMFLNDKTRELMFCSNEKWFRVPSESGIAGYAIVTGETLNIPVAADDYRYNEYVKCMIIYMHKCSTYAHTCMFHIV